MICKPDAVVMGFPAVWADAVVAIMGGAIAAARAVNAVCMIVRREACIFNGLSSINRDVSSLTGRALPPRQPTQIRRTGSPVRHQFNRSLMGSSGPGYPRRCRHHLLGDHRKPRQLGGAEGSGNRDIGGIAA